MEATEKKKKRNGGYYLKEKIAKLQDELAKAESARNNYSAQLGIEKTETHNLNIEVKELQAKLSKAEAERDSWHNNYKSEHDFHVEAAEKRREAVERLEFVLEHCGPFTRWLYKHQFGK